MTGGMLQVSVRQISDCCHTLGNLPMTQRLYQSDDVFLALMEQQPQETLGRFRVDGRTRVGVATDRR